MSTHKHLERALRQPGLKQKSVAAASTALTDFLSVLTLHRLHEQHRASCGPVARGCFVLIARTSTAVVWDVLDDMGVRGCVRVIGARGLNHLNHPRLCSFRWMSDRIHFGTPFPGNGGCGRRPHHQESLRALASRYGVNPKTVAKWRKRSSTADLRTGPKEPRSTVLSVEDEAIILAFRRHAAAAGRLPLCPAGDHPAPAPLVIASLPAASRDRPAASKVAIPRGLFADILCPSNCGRPSTRWNESQGRGASG
jgi:hypothetical protein